MIFIVHWTGGRPSAYLVSVAPHADYGATWQWFWSTFQANWMASSLSTCAATTVTSCTPAGCLGTIPRATSALIPWLGLKYESRRCKKIDIRDGQSLFWVLTQHQWLKCQRHESWQSYFGSETLNLKPWDPRGAHLPLRQAPVALVLAYLVRPHAQHGVVVYLGGMRQRSFSLHHYIHLWVQHTLHGQQCLWAPHVISSFL